MGKFSKGHHRFYEKEPFDQKCPDCGDKTILYEQDSSYWIGAKWKSFTKYRCQKCGTIIEVEK